MKILLSLFVVSVLISPTFAQTKGNKEVYRDLAKLGETFRKVTTEKNPDQTELKRNQEKTAALKKLFDERKDGEVWRLEFKVLDVNEQRIKLTPSVTRRFAEPEKQGLGKLGLQAPYEIPRDCEGLKLEPSLGRQTLLTHGLKSTDIDNLNKGDVVVVSGKNPKITTINGSDSSGKPGRNHFYRADSEPLNFDESDPVSVTIIAFAPPTIIAQKLGAAGGIGKSTRAIPKTTTIGVDFDKCLFSIEKHGKNQ
jgi:hypothetical protein